MMKSAEIVKELEIAAANAVRDLIDYVPNLEIGSVDYEEHIGRDQIDLRIALKSWRRQLCARHRGETEWGTALCPFRDLSP